jgi:predicted amidohydrolase
MPIIEPYMAVGLVTTVWGAQSRADITRNIEHIHGVMKAAAWLSSLDYPVRYVAIPEGALQGFTDEVFDTDHAQYAAESAIDIPGPETDMLGEIAREFDVYLVAQAKAKDPDFEGVFFNIGFILDPQGEVILKHYKSSPLFPVEHSVCPHDVLDRWIELHGRSLQSFFPVVDTPIGRLAVMMANEGSYPENARALAMNGAEVIYRPSYPHPATGNEFFEIQSRARALDNNLYVVAPNTGTYFLRPDSEWPVDTFGGRSFIFDYRGRIVGKHEYGGGSSYVAGVVDIEALRLHRARSQWTNWMKDLRTELYQMVYEEPIYPRNLYADRVPYDHATYATEVNRPQVEAMHERGIWARPGHDAAPAETAPRPPLEVSGADT